MVQPTLSQNVIDVLWEKVLDARDKLVVLLTLDQPSISFDAMRDQINTMEAFVVAIDTLHGSPPAASAPTPTAAPQVVPSAPTAAQAVAAALGVTLPPTSDISSIDSINHL